jgi:hypothetical protein
MKIDGIGDDLQQRMAALLQEGVVCLRRGGHPA